MNQLSINREAMEKWNDKRASNEKKAIAKFWHLKETFKKMKNESKL